MRVSRLALVVIVLGLCVIRAEASGPIIASTPTVVNFGVVNTGSSSTLYVTVANLGDANLNITSTSMTGNFASAGTGTCSPTAIVPGGTCTLSVKFTPPTAGLNTGTLSISSNAPGSPNSVPLTGIGGPDPDQIDAPASLNFGTVSVGTTSTTQFVTVNNTGNTNLTFTTAASFSPADYAAAGSGTCIVSQPVAPNGSCTISVKFTPSTTGTRNGTMTITTNAPGSPFVVHLGGIGGSGSNLSLNANSLAFGSIAQGNISAAKTVTVTNIGNSDLHFTQSVTLSAGFESGGIGTCSSSSPVAPAAACTLSAEFVPTADGSIAGTMTIFTDAPGSPATVALSGIGVPTLWPGAAHVHVPAQYATIQAAINAAVNGSNTGTVIHVAPGTYTENLLINKSGMDDTHRLALVSDQKWGAKIVAAANPVQGFMIDVEGTYVDIIGFEITGGTGGGSVSMSTIHGSAPPPLPGNFNRLLASYIHDSGPPNCTPNVNCRACVYTAGDYTIDGVGTSHDITISGNLVQNCGTVTNGVITYNMMVHGIYVTNPFAVVTNNIVLNTAGYGIHVWHAASHDAIENNTVVNGLGGGIMVASEDAGCNQNNVDSIIVNNVVAGTRSAVDQTQGTGCSVVNPVYSNNLLFMNCQKGSAEAAQTNEVTGDPKFAAISAWPNFGTCSGGGSDPTITGDFSILSGSAAIDVATRGYTPPNNDFTGAPRPVGSVNTTGAPDIGAFEFKFGAIWGKYPPL